LILLAVFVLDATFTLISRVLRGEQWYTAHRSHAYQRGVQLGWPHRRVTLTVGAINSLVLYPLAAIAVVFPKTQIWVTGVMVLAAWLIWKAVQDKHRQSTQGH
jgi:Fuc2NAc and GlcNAc transferase